MKEVIVIGAGGHSSVIIEIIESMIDSGHDLKIKGLLDDNEKISEFMGYKIIDKIENAMIYNSEDTEYVIAIGNNQTRKKIYSKFKNLKYFTAIHPSAIVSKSSVIKEGTVVMARSVINANSEVGSHVIINTGAIIEHDDKIGDFCHISPGATLCGGVTIGEETHIGANSTIIQYKSVGSKTIIGAGATVINDIESNVVAIGCPAKPKQ
ncbi:acetyltransferase [Paraclostridium bifermentans]|uniref:acetyltransferase n=1 Tax=Paraclostridium bifermentans TaxID=1490 RepID=UPI0034DF3B15